MDCELSIIPGKRIVLSRYVGPISTAQRQRNRQRTLDFCRQHGITRILLDTREHRSQSTTLELFRFAEEMRDVTEGYQFAFVRTPDDEDIRFLDDASANRGCHCRSFLSMAEALEWLEAAGTTQAKANEPTQSGAATNSAGAAGDGLKISPASR